MQQLHKKATLLKEACMNGFRALRSTFQLLYIKDLTGLFEDGIATAFIRLFGEEASTFRRTLSHKMDKLEQQLSKEKHHEHDSKAALTMLKTHFHKDMDFIEQSMLKTILHDKEFEQRINERNMQTKQEKVDMVKALDDSSAYTKSNGTVSGIHNVSSSSGNERNKIGNEHSMPENKSSVSGNGNNSSWDKSSRSWNENIKSGTECNYSGIESNSFGNDTDDDGADINPTCDSDSLEKVPSNDKYNVFATNGQHTEQLESINDAYVMEKIDSDIISDSLYMSYNEGKVDQDAAKEEERALLV
ncbi:hypothetical protein Tco_1539920 [Tanacetum coccineum]